MTEPRPLVTTAQSLFEKLAPLLFRRLQQFLADFRRARELVDPVIWPAGVDDRHRAGVVAGFFFILGQARIDLIAPDSPADTERSLRIAARRQRPHDVIEIERVD